MGFLDYEGQYEAEWSRICTGIKNIPFPMDGWRLTSLPRFLPSDLIELGFLRFLELAFPKYRVSEKT